MSAPSLCPCLRLTAHVDSELLLSYDAFMPRDIMVMVVRLAILLSVLLTVPLIHFPVSTATSLYSLNKRNISHLLIYSFGFFTQFYEII